MYKFACQSITFGDYDNLNKMNEVIYAISMAGYKGIEIGFGRLNSDNINYLRGSNIEIAGIHIGGNYIDPDASKKHMQNILAIITACHALNSIYVFISGTCLTNKSCEDYKNESANYNALGKMLKSEGLTLCYHNHYWEIEGNLFGLKSLNEFTSPEYMSFIPDVGWITKGGADPVSVLNIIKDRIKNVHFKEFTEDGRFTELGKGIVDFKGVYQFIKDMDIDWIVAEQDKSEIGAIQSINQNLQFMNSLERVYMRAN
jgi:sugar phosphate isomerase/epimerase